MLGNFILFSLLFVWYTDTIHRYKYVPNLLKEILFPSPRSSSSDQPPSRKRRRTQDSEDSIEMEIEDDNNIASTSSVSPQQGDILRPIILDTVKESYLLSPSSGDVRQTYDIALILEAEVVVEEEPPLVESERNLDGGDDTLPPAKPIDGGPSTTEGTTIITQSKTPESRLDKEEEMPPSSSPPPTDTLTLEDELSAKPQFAVQVLQRNLTKDMFRFMDEGVYVKEDGMETDSEWVIQVKDWKWAPKSLSSRERV